MSSTWAASDKALIALGSAGGVLRLILVSHDLVVEGNILRYLVEFVLHFLFSLVIS